MTDRADIGTGRLIYTCNCGFIDTGHANPTSAAGLWDKIRNERHEAYGWSDGNYTLDGQPAFVVSYSQGMGNRAFTFSKGGRFLIRKGLTTIRMKEVALAIFMRVSADFEGMQENAFWRRVTDSGFSLEDLMSNLIGFYRAVEGVSMDEVRRACGAVGKAATYKVYDANLSGGIGRIKVRRFLEPQFFPCDECMEAPSLPQLFASIRAAKPEDGTFIRLPESMPVVPRLLNKPIDFDRAGRPR